MSSSARRAAQYLRMSTDQQEGSLDNQAAAIAERAAALGLEVVRTYSDPGQSGLTLRDRPGIRRLLDDVVGGRADFATVLVLDVSRWGRFQDPDQAASCEFLCRQGGVSVRYCAEEADGGDTLVAEMVKHLRRVAAAEFSQMRSETARLVHRSNAARGFRQGGPAPFGVRRLLIDAVGMPIGVMERDDRKPLREQRVVTAAGPNTEAAAVRRIFALFVRGGLRPREIAERMAAEGPARPSGGAWTSRAVLRLLRNEIYTGTYVYGRRTAPLRSAARLTPAGSWVRAEVIAPLVDAATFATAGRMIGPPLKYGDAWMLAQLRRLKDESGRLDTRLIDGCPYTPNAQAYRRRFGGLAGAYGRVGYERPRGPRLADEALLDVLRELARTHGYVERRLLSADSALPHPETYRLRFGDFRRACALAGIDSGLVRGRRRRAAPLAVERRRAGASDE